MIFLNITQHIYELDSNFGVQFAHNIEPKKIDNQFRYESKLNQRKRFVLQDRFGLVFQIYKKLIDQTGPVLVHKNIIKG